MTYDKKLHVRLFFFCHFVGKHLAIFQRVVLRALQQNGAQWTLHYLPSRDKSCFLYPRQHLSNHRREKDLTITRVNHYFVEDCKLWLLSTLCWIAKTRDFLKCRKQVLSYHYKSRVSAFIYVTKIKTWFSTVSKQKKTTTTHNKL